VFDTYTTYGSHRSLHGLQHLGLHYQDPLKSRWWRRIGSIVVIVLICDAVASVCHLVIMKRFEIEIEIKIKIKDSQLCASRYNDD
jgi:hypothetical protein